MPELSVVQSQKLTLSVDSLVPNEWNPNTMSDLEFNALCQDIKANGMIGAIQVVGKQDSDKYTIIGGEHRWRAAKILGITEVLCDVYPADAFDMDRQKLQTVRWNIIHGRLNPVKFVELFDEMSKRYDKETLRESMAFTSQAAFEAVYKQVKDSLPPELQKKLDAAKSEIKTIDDLSLVLNTLFTQYGSELKCSFMTFVWGGEIHTMVEMNKECYNVVDRVKKRCVAEGLNINDFLVNGLHHALEAIKPPGPFDNATSISGKAGEPIMVDGKPLDGTAPQDKQGETPPPAGDPQ